MTENKTYTAKILEIIIKNFNSEETCTEKGVTNYDLSEDFDKQKSAENAKVNLNNDVNEENWDNLLKGEEINLYCNKDSTSERKEKVTEKGIINYNLNKEDFDKQQKSAENAKMNLNNDENKKKLDNLQKGAEINLYCNRDSTSESKEKGTEKGIINYNLNKEDFDKQQKSTENAKMNLNNDANKENLDNLQIGAGCAEINLECNNVSSSEIQQKDFGNTKNVNLENFKDLVSLDKESKKTPTDMEKSKLSAEIILDSDKSSNLEGQQNNLENTKKDNFENPKDKKLRKLPANIEKSKLAENNDNLRPKNENPTVKNYYDEEKEDIDDPEWEAMRSLETNEERYAKVRDCWQSKTVPNPHRNLTYHSFRKKLLQPDGLTVRKIKQHKRQASSNSQQQDSKRSRMCTYVVDDKINSLKKEKEDKERALMSEMQDKIDSYKDYQQRHPIPNYYYDGSYEYYDQYDHIHSIREREISAITREYYAKTDQSNSQYQSEIKRLENARQEMRQFRKFYKGFNNVGEKDPAILTEFQLQEVKEIEEIYNQFEKFYKN